MNNKFVGISIAAIFAILTFATPVSAHDYDDYAPYWYGNNHNRYLNHNFYKKNRKWKKHRNKRWRRYRDRNIYWGGHPVHGYNHPGHGAFHPVYGAQNSVERLVRGVLYNWY